MPKPRQAGADLHREPAEKPDEPPEEPPESNIDTSQLNQRPQSHPPSGGSSSPLPFSNKTLLMLAGVMVIAFLIYRQSSSGGPGRRQARFEDPEPETGPGQPNIQRDPNDPLGADEEALDWLTGDKARELADWAESQGEEGGE